MKRREFLIKSLAAGGLLAAGSTMPVQTAVAATPKKFKVKPADDNWVIISDLHTNPGAYQDEYLQRAVADILKLTPRPTHVIAPVTLPTSQDSSRNISGHARFWRPSGRLAYN